MGGNSQSQEIREPARPQTYPPRPADVVEEFTVPFRLLISSHPSDLQKARNIDGIVEIKSDPLPGKDLVNFKIFAKSREAAKLARKMIEEFCFRSSISKTLPKDPPGKESKASQNVAGKPQLSSAPDRKTVFSSCSILKDTAGKENKVLPNFGVKCKVPSVPVFAYKVDDEVVEDYSEMNDTLHTAEPIRRFGIIVEFKQWMNNQYQAFVKCDLEKYGRVFVPVSADHKDRPLSQTYQFRERVSFFPKLADRPFKGSTYVAYKLTKTESDGSPEPYEKDVNGKVDFVADCYGFIHFNLKGHKLRAYFHNSDVGNDLTKKPLNELYPAGSRITFDVHMQPPQNNCEFRAQNIKLVAKPLLPMNESMKSMVEIDLKNFDRLNVQSGSSSTRSTNSFDRRNNFADDFSNVDIEGADEEEEELKNRSFSPSNTLKLVLPENQLVKSTGSTSRRSLASNNRHDNPQGFIPHRRGQGRGRGRGRGGFAARAPHRSPTSRSTSRGRRGSTENLSIASDHSSKRGGYRTRTRRQPTSSLHDEVVATEETQLAKNGVSSSTTADNNANAGQASRVTSLAQFKEVACQSDRMQVLEAITTVMYDDEIMPIVCKKYPNEFKIIVSCRR